MQYWPSEGTEKYGLVSVTLKDEKLVEDYVIRKFSLTNKTVLGSISVYRTQWRIQDFSDGGAHTWFWKCDVTNTTFFLLAGVEAMHVRACAKLGSFGFQRTALQLQTGQRASVRPLPRSATGTVPFSTFRTEFMTSRSPGRLPNSTT